MKFWGKSQHDLSIALAGSMVQRKTHVQWFKGITQYMRAWHNVLWHWTVSLVMQKNIFVQQKNAVLSNSCFI